MRFSHVTISVNNLDDSLDFYQGIIGLPIKRRFSAGDSEIIFLGNNDTDIELIYNRSQPDISFGKSISLGFAVPSLKDVLTLLREKKIEAGEIIQPTPQVMFFFTTDPNGVRIQFVEYIGE